MNSDTVIGMTLEARGLLLEEISEQLEGIYGLLPNGQFRSASEYPALANNTEAMETRQRLETLLNDEKQVGIPPQQAREKLVKETAFTWLNRLVAFKMMEARKILRQSVTRGQDSNGFKMWLTESGNEKHLKDYETGDLPQDSLGEGPRQRAYRHFLLAQCGRLAQEIRVLFDPDNLSSRLLPRPQALRQLIDMLNDEKLLEAWQAGNEETIGWVYQGFNAEELENAFREVRVSKKKFEASDIPAVTQLFTPRWIVRFLVENTLGRMWVDMHPDSKLKDTLGYLVPIEGKRQTPLKSVCEITLLDPACGTMHFGLVAFDLYVDMYREEMANVGKNGWPEKAPLDSEDQIPAAIIAHNIHGIDIDLRAVQLSAMALYLKAKTLSPKVELRQSRLACADIHMLDGGRLKDFLKEAGLEKRPIYGRILTALQERLKDAEQLGSLLRLEEEIRSLVEQEKQRYEREAGKPDLFGWSTEQFETEAGQQEFWEMLEIQIGQALNEFARQQAATGQDQSFFSGETTKGLQLLDVMARRYDVIVTNPPYMSARKMNATLKKLVASDYPAGKGDLYAAFIQRCLEFTNDNGRVGMLTMHSFMFITSYEKLRTYIREQVAIETLNHAGPCLFAVGNPGTLQTAAYVLRRELNDQVRNDSEGTYFRLVKESDGQAKQRRFEQALGNLHTNRDDTMVSYCRQGDLDAIPGSPWVYWLNRELQTLFQSMPSFSETTPPRQGLATGDNRRFTRYWWEIGTELIAFYCSSSDEAINTQKKWFPYMKGGGALRWYGNLNYIINWYNNGEELFAFVPTAVIRNQRYYFKRGVTYSLISSSMFTARLSPGGFVFDVSGSSIHSNQPMLLLAILNSSMCAYFLRLLNPTINYQVGDVARLPQPDLENRQLEMLVTDVVEMARQNCVEDEITYDFVAPAVWKTGASGASARQAQMNQLEEQINDNIYILYGVSNEARMSIDAELKETLIDDNNDQIEKGSESEETIDAGHEVFLTIKELAQQWISYAVGIVMCRFQPGIDGALGRGNFSEDLSERLKEVTDPDGALVLDFGHSDDLATNSLKALNIMLGEKAATEVVAEATGRSGNTEEELRQYFERNFFREHIQKYRKRPVYWLLQSPRKKYSVWLFHERLTKDTLHRIRGDDYVGSKIKLLESQLRDLKQQYDGAEGRQRRLLEKQIDGLQDALDDIQEFARKIDTILQRGYTPHIDDGVLINMAPLWELIPSWQTEPKKCWEALERGDYDWSYQAMDHWPERVKEKCKTNKSYAIAHGLAE